MPRISLVLPRMARRVTALGCLVAGLAVQPLSAQERVVVTRSGQPAIVGVVIDCTDHYLPGSASGAAGHGTVSAEQRKVPACGKAEELAWVFTYTSEPAFKGRDGVTMYLGSGSFFRAVDVQ